MYTKVRCSADCTNTLLVTHVLSHASFLLHFLIFLLDTFTLFINTSCIARRNICADATSVSLERCPSFACKSTFVPPLYSRSYRYAIVTLCSYPFKMLQFTLTRQRSIRFTPHNDVKEVQRATYAE